MSEWNAKQYLKFKEQRTQPAIDLAARIASRSPAHVLDVGCGPGNSTCVLKNTFPDADILGVDSSQNMINKAKETYPDINFKLCDVTTDLDSLGSFDVIFSNACLQWIPNHKEFLPKLLGKLNKDGILAVQIPINGQEKLFKIADEIVREPRWGFSEKNFETNDVLEPEEYFDILSACDVNFDIWESVYYHNMPTIEAMVEWIKGTRLRPYLNSLNEVSAGEMEREIVKRAAASYTKQQNGEFILKFRRLFFTAVK